MKNKNNKGFSLIEMMITVVITGILATVSVAAYQNYSVKAQIAEAFTLSSGIKTALFEFYSVTGKPLNIIYHEQRQYKGLLAEPSVGKYTSSKFNYNNKVISTFTENAHKDLVGKSIVMKLHEPESNNFAWDCVSNLETKYLPNNCKALAPNDSLTPIIYDSAAQKHKNVKFLNPNNELSSTAFSAHVNSYNRAINDYALSGEPAKNIINWGITMRQMKQQLINQGKSVVGFPDIPVFKPSPDDNFDYRSWYNDMVFNNPEHALYQIPIEIDDGK